MKILAIVLAAGEGSRVRHLLQDDEPIKAMIRVGDARLIETTLATLDRVTIDRAVLTFPNERYQSLNETVAKHPGVRLLVQKAKHRKLPTMLELPYILLWQYHFSSDAQWLKSYDAIMTMPCDLLFSQLDMAQFVALYERWHDHPLQRKIAVLSKLRQEGGRCDLFQKEGERIMAMKKFEGEILDGWTATTQAGVYIFSKGLLKNPLGFLLGFKRNLAIQYTLEDDWWDCGDPAVLAKVRATSNRAIS